jgi:hypothetical protein
MLFQLALFAPDKKDKLKNRVQLEIISTADARYMLEKFHYLHRSRVGAQINYAVLIDGMVDGIITYALPMMSAPILGIPSDELLEFARLFLYSNIPHSATCAIGKSLRRIKRDWNLLHPAMKTPRLIVSWSDTTRHKGTIYKAANFEWLRKSTGAPWGKQQREPGSSKRGDRERHGDYGNIKDCWIYHI